MRHFSVLVSTSKFQERIFADAWIGPGTKSRTVIVKINYRFVSDADSRRISDALVMDNVALPTLDTALKLHEFMLVTLKTHLTARWGIEIKPAEIYMNLPQIF